MKELMILTVQSPKVFNFLYSNWVFTIPASLLIFSILMCIFSSDDFQTKIKRLYYTIFIFGYLIFIRYEDVTVWCKNGYFNLSSNVWSILFSMLVVLIIAMVIDNFIISGYVFKEFGLFGAKFIREETKQAVKEQDGYTMLLEKSYESLYYTLGQINQLFQEDKLIESLHNKTFSYTKQFTEVLKCYYEDIHQNVFVHVQIYNKHPDSVKKLISALDRKYHLTLTDRHKLHKCLSCDDLGASHYFDLGYTKIFVITAKPSLCSINEMLFISIESKKEINIYDFYPILCFLNYFEALISNF